MKTKAFYLICLNLILIQLFGKVYAQTNNTTTNTINRNVNRPTDSLGITEVDLYVTKCYDFYDQTNILNDKLNAIEQHIIINKTSDVDTKVLESQLNDFELQLTGLRILGNGLIESGSDMTDKVTSHLKTRPFKIPGAIIRVKNATKAVKISVQVVYTMLTVTLVNIKHKLNIKDADGSARRKSDGSNAMDGAGKTVTTWLNITGMGFSGFNSLSKELNNISIIKSTSKKFNASGNSVIEIVHFGTTDDLLAAILSNCKDVVSEKNVASSEEGKISFNY